MLAELGKVIVGQREVLERLSSPSSRAATIARRRAGSGQDVHDQHARPRARAPVQAQSNHADLMPSAIVGTNIIEENHETGKRVTVFVAGPIFKNIVLATKSTAAAEDAGGAAPGHAGARSHRGRPDLQTRAAFFVLATQNPIDQEGTYRSRGAEGSLPDEHVHQISELEEGGHRDADDDEHRQRRAPILDGPTLLAHQQLVRSIPVSKARDRIRGGPRRGRRDRTNPACRRSSRNRSAGVPSAREPGAILAAKCTRRSRPHECLVLRRRAHVALPVLRHRILASFTAEAEGITTDSIVQQLLKEVRRARHV